MSGQIVRMPKEKRVKPTLLAKARRMSVNKLIDEMVTLLLTVFDADTRFRVRSARGAGYEKRGLELLSKAASGGVRRSAVRRKCPRARQSD
jgi:hypothetical protein